MSHTINKFSITSLALIFLTTIFIQPKEISANANNGEAFTDEEFESTYEFLTEEALTYENGTPQFDLEIIEEEFGHIPEEYVEFNEKALNETTNQSETITTASTSVTECVRDEFYGNFTEIAGITAISSAIDALQQGQRIQAAQHLIRAGARGGLHGIAANLIWIEIQCFGEQIG